MTHFIHPGIFDTKVTHNDLRFQTELKLNWKISFFFTVLYCCLFSISFTVHAIDITMVPHEKQVHWVTVCFKLLDKHCRTKQTYRCMILVIYFLFCFYKDVWEMFQSV